MHSVLGWISQYGYVGLFCLLMVGIAGLPVPDETLLLFSGYLILRGHLNPWLTFLAAFAGSSFGISLSYIIGRTAGLRFAERFGHYIHLSEAHLSRLNRWFSRAGGWSLTAGYFVPGIRHFTALVAGMSNLRYTLFAAFAYPGAIIWVATFLCMGYFLGEKWERASAAVQRDLLLTTCAVCVTGGAIWLLRKWWQRQSP